MTEERDKAALEKERAKADAQFNAIQEQIESRQVEHDRLKPMYIKMYGKKAYNKMWDGIKEKYPLPPPLPREKRVSRDDPRLKEAKEKKAKAVAQRAEVDRAAASSSADEKTQP